MSVDQPVHGTAVAWVDAGGRRAVLITGAPGAGKSDLALRLIGRGWRLVGDDYVHVFASGGSVYAAAAPGIAGLIEVRGQGPVPRCAAPVTRVALLVELARGPVERLPEPETRRVAGLPVPLLRVDPFEASVVEKVAAAIAPL